MRDYSPKPPRTRRPPRPTRAPVLLLCALCLVALGAGASRLVLWPASQNPTRSLAYATALRILCDSGEEEGRREAAQGRVFGSVQLGIRTLQIVRSEGGELEARAARLLGELRDQLYAREPIVVRTVTEPPQALAARALDTRETPPDRLEELEILTRASGCGIAALRRIQAGSAPLRLKAAGAELLLKLERQVEL